MEKKLNASDEFLAKYGHTCAEHTAIMADEIKAMRKAREEHEASLIRPGRLDPAGMVYPA